MAKDQSSSIAFVIIPIIFNLIPMFLLCHLLLLPLGSFLLPILSRLVHIFNPQLHLQTLHLDGDAHYLSHFLFCQLLFPHLEFVESVVIWWKMHQFVTNGMSWILGHIQGVQHFLLSFFISFNIVNLSDAILENIVTTALHLTATLIILNLPLTFSFLQLI